MTEAMSIQLEKGTAVPNIEFIRKKFNEKGLILLTNHYIDRKSPLKFICSNHGTLETTWGKFIRNMGCHECKGKTVRWEDVDKEFNNRGYQLKTKIYINNKQELVFDCPVHKEQVTTWANFRRSKIGCKDCSKERTNKNMDIKRTKLNEKDKHIVGERFSRLLVIKIHSMEKKKPTKFLCRCTCGKEVITTRFKLESKNTRSCGCIRKERKKERITLNGESLTMKEWAQYFKLSQKKLKQLLSQGYDYEELRTTCNGLYKNQTDKEKVILHIKDKLKEFNKAFECTNIAKQNCLILNEQKVLIKYAIGNSNNKGCFNLTQTPRRNGELYDNEIVLANGRIRKQYHMSYSHIIFVVDNKGRYDCWIIPTHRISDELQSISFSPYRNGKYDSYRENWNII
ncbi:hypothetical protein CN384_07030 [Bacillus thuringiensis]|uniref:hypothetical protein n=1 Tax=Bacillus cereus group TaxID=86661 RepID=UPI000BF734F6|nr:MULTISPECIES: hypothetical protein [Bacillus cereus group]PES55647.1 hypothetical protein CN515_06470 [Bacillus cereus]PFA29447.1 hypothetical protein CN384_07030 [Bacillus thuringiensis]PGW10657.1 hypothetical protein COD97_17355 [Bacillus cereus]